MSRLEQKVKVQPTIPQSVEDFFRLNFEKPTGAMGRVLYAVSEFSDRHPGQSFFETPLDCLEHALNLHRAMMHQARRLLKGVLTLNELAAIISVMNATALTHGTPGETLRGNVEDIFPEELMVEVDLPALRQKINALGIFERAYLELWAWGFWYAPGFAERKLDDYIKLIS